jgi:D-lactate dehydrogenase
VHAALSEQYEYDGIQTCAVDGSCMTACPVAIDTGTLIKDLRRAEHGPRAQRVALELAKRYGVAERVARAGVPVARRVARARGRTMPPAAPAKLPRTQREGAAAVYLPSCLNRIFGRADGAGSDPAGLTLPEALVAISARARRPLWIPPDVAGHCCATPWSSKGYADGLAEMASRTAVALRRWTAEGQLPVVMDASSCSLGLRENLSLGAIEVIDSVAWVHDHLLERLELSHRVGTALVHPTCAAGQLGVSAKLIAVAGRLAEEVVVPATTRCCGMAGDRGWLHPELPAAALADTAAELDGRSFDVCLSSNRTCEIALQQVTGRTYESLVLTLEALTR